MPSSAKPAAPGRLPALLALGYAGVAYALFAAVFAYLVGFVAGVGVPKDVDHGPHAPWPAAAAIDLLLVALFAVSHSVMARPAVKRRLALPAPAERATYVLASSAVLALLCWQWRPLGAVAWSLHGPARAAVFAVAAGGWLLALSSTFLISHADLFGLRQAWLPARGAAYAPPPFTERGLYRRIRHPLMAGFLVAFWAAPRMTAGHLLLAAAMTGYILAGIAFEERDLRHALGQAYADYAARVPALVPRLRRPAATPPAAPQATPPAVAPAQAAPAQAAPAQAAPAPDGPGAADLKGASR